MGAEVPAPVAQVPVPMSEGGSMVEAMPTLAEGVLALVEDELRLGK